MKKIILVVLALMLTACSASSTYNQNLKKWQGANISHYRYQLVIGCFCPFYEDMPLTIEVENGVVVSIARTDGTLVDSTDPAYETYSAYATIDRLFAQLESEMADADEVNVDYDSQFGFPANISIDLIKEAVDDELSLQVTNFEVLP
jgi:hypothetical protein